MSATKPNAANDQRSLAAEITRLKGLTLKRACADPMLTDGDFRTLYAAFDQIHHKRGLNFGLFWPAAKTLAVASCSSLSRVRASLKRLKAAGYIEPVWKGGGRMADGRGITTRYRAIFKTVTSAAHASELDTVPFGATYSAKIEGSTVPGMTHNPSENPNDYPADDVGNSVRIQNGSLPKQAPGERQTAEPKLADNVVRPNWRSIKNPNLTPAERELAIKEAARSRQRDRSEGLA